MSSLLPPFFLRIDIECHKCEGKLAGNIKKGLTTRLVTLFGFILCMKMTSGLKWVSFFVHHCIKFK